MTTEAKRYKATKTKRGFSLTCGGKSAEFVIEKYTMRAAFYRVRSTT